MEIRIPYMNMSEILGREYNFVSRAKSRNEKRIELYKKMIRELETENEYYDTKMVILQREMRQYSQSTKKNLKKQSPTNISQKKL